MTSGRNFEAKPSTKSLLAKTPAQCFRQSASSSNFQRELSDEELHGVTGGTLGANATIQHKHIAGVKYQD
jgi:hypothetical protein